MELTHLHAITSWLTVEKKFIQLTIGESDLINVSIKSLQLD